jgi:hypothetical protein
MPLIIFATAHECAKAMGCDIHTFFSYLSRFNKGRPYPKKYLIYEDEIDEEEKEELQNPPKLSAIDYEIILAMASGCVKRAAVAKWIKRDVTAVYNHLHKIQRITGLDPRDKNDLAKLVLMANAEKEGKDCR